MRLLQVALLASLVAASVFTVISPTVVQSQSGPPASANDSIRRQRFTHRGAVDGEAPAADFGRDSGATEAPTGFDNLTNGFDQQGPPFDSLDEHSVVPLRSFNDNRFIFEEVETVD